MPDLALLGFDLRLKNLISLPEDTSLAKLNPSDQFRSTDYPATISEIVWPRPAGFDPPDDQLNDQNLLYLPDYFYQHSHNFPNAMPVAFAAHGISTCSDDTVSANPNRMLLPTRGWTLLGFDIVDKWFAFSAFYGFTWGQGQLLNALRDKQVLFNQCGILGTFEMAEELVPVFNNLDADHAPFRVCGVWAQQSAASPR